MAFWSGRKFPQVLALAFSLPSFLAVLIVGVLIGRSVQKTALDELIRSLTNQASVMREQIDPSFFLSRKILPAEELADRLSKSSHCRVTFVTKDGVVLGDSSLPLNLVSVLENHKDRPEIHEAILNGTGHSSRLSSTLHEEFLYVAVAVPFQGSVVGVVRLAYPLTELKKRQRLINFHILWLSIAALSFSTLIAIGLARPLSRPVDEISEAAKALADRMQSAGKELSHDRAHLAAILSNMEEGVMAVDQTGRITAVNPAISAMFGIKGEEANGKYFLEAIRHSGLNQLVQDVLRDLEPRTDEVHAYAPDERVFEARVVPLIQESRLGGALLVLHDITRLRRLEQVRRDFVANVSHELRTPLAAIKGFTETLIDGAIKDSKVAIEFLKSVERHTDNMTALVEDLLDLTAIESGQRTPIKENLNLGEMAPEIIKGLMPMANKRKIQISFEFGEGAGVVLADPKHFKQILGNLVDNAIKFNQNGGWVKIRSERKPGGVELTVGDSGLGIPPQDMGRIFERFYRVDKARSRAMGGTGLGLAIVKHLVETNGGMITVESSTGKGSIFFVFLPL